MGDDAKSSSARHARDLKVMQKTVNDARKNLEQSKEKRRQKAVKRKLQ